MLSGNTLVVHHDIHLVQSAADCPTLLAVAEGMPSQSLAVLEDFEARLRYLVGWLRDAIKALLVCQSLCCNWQTTIANDRIKFCKMLIPAFVNFHCLTNLLSCW
jgi:hypothetical protein